MIKPILTVPHQTLRTLSKDVVVDKKIFDFISSLSDTLFAKDNPKGVGLSAPQLGKNWNVFVSWLPKDGEDDPIREDLKVFINPVITDASKEMTLGPDKEDPILEGCLSIPGFYGPVPRHEWIEVEFLTIPGQRIFDPLPSKQRFSGFEARVVQHEHDHLKGILFTDHSLRLDLPVYEFVGKQMKAIDKEILRVL